MRRKFNPLLTRGVIICAVVALALCAWSSVFSALGATDPLRVAAVTVSSPLTRLLDRVGTGLSRGLAATFGRDAQYNEWMAEKAALEEAIAARDAQLSELQSLRDQNDQLRAYLSLTEHTTSLVLTEAHVLYTADTTTQLISLDRGSRHGVEVGMPVLSGSGLIGRVCEVMPFSCKVATLYSEKLAVGVRNVRSGVSGTLSVSTDADGLCKMTDMDANIDRETALMAGDVIVTSGYGGNFPADIAVGVIVESGVNALDRTPYAIVAPYADLSDTAALYMIVTDIQTETVLPDPSEPSDEGGATTDGGVQEGEQPEQPTEDEDAPADAVDPVDPIDPIAPIDPTQPSDPTQPTDEEVAL